jgi:hypothetical protein
VRSNILSYLKIINILELLLSSLVQYARVTNQELATCIFGDISLLPNHQTGRNIIIITILNDKDNAETP